jgi:hypothetical protein
MRQYSVEFTASVTGSMAGRDDGQPYRTRKIGADKYHMFKFYQEKLAEEGKRYGWQEPVLCELDVTELSGAEALVYIEAFEKTRNIGAGI